MLRRLSAGCHDARRIRLCRRISRRALSARVARRPHRAGDSATHPLLHCRAGARFAEVLLKREPVKSLSLLVLTLALSPAVAADLAANKKNVVEFYEKAINQKD